MEEREYIELRSEEVQEILGTPPGWLVRWGTLVLFLCFAALLGVAAMISYPDTVQAKVIITTAVPPVDVVARTDGRIAHFYARDKMPVKRGAVLVVFQSNADYNDIKRLDAAVQNWQRLNKAALAEIDTPTDLILGEVEPAYLAFVQELENVLSGKKSKTSARQNTSQAINRQIDKLEKSLEADQKSMYRLRDQIASTKKLYLEQKKSFDAGLIARSEVEKTSEFLENLEAQYDILEDNIFRKQHEIINLGKNKSQQPHLGAPSETADPAERLVQRLNALRASLDKWNQTYVLAAPTEGKIALNATFFTEKQFVKKDEQVLSIVPPQTNKLIGRLSLPQAGSGKVRPGQRVILKLDSYPYFEFGTLRGLVLSKSLTPQNNEYSILVSLPDGLQTSYRQEIPFEQQLQGKAEIITDEKRFLQRIYEQVFVPRN